MSESSVSLQRKAYLKRRQQTKTAVITLRIGILVVLFAGWEIAARLGAIDAFIVSSPSRMWNTFMNLYRSGDLWLHVGTSVIETVVGFLLGTLTGTVIAVLLWWSDFLSRVLDPYLVVLNALPKTAMGPIFIVWIGAGPSSIIAMTLAISLIVTILDMHNGFLDTDPEKIRLMRTLGSMP